MTMHKEFANQRQKKCSLTYSFLICFPKFVITSLLCNNYILQQYGSNKKKNLSTEQKKGFYEMEREDLFLSWRLKNYFQMSFVLDIFNLPLQRWYPLSFLPHWALCPRTLTSMDDIYRSSCLPYPLPPTLCQAKG